MRLLCGEPARKEPEGDALWGENTDGGGCHAGTAQNFTAAMPQEAEAAMAGAHCFVACARRLWGPRKNDGVRTVFSPPKLLKALCMLSLLAEHKNLWVKD